MKKFAGMSYDVTDLVSDGSIEYLSTLVKNDPDELEKHAHIPSKDEVETIPSDEFALVLYHPQVGFLRKYATHDKYITKLNLKIFEDRRQDYPDEIAKTAAYYLVKAAQHFRIPVSKEITKLAEGNHITNVVDLTMLNEPAWVRKQQMSKTAEEVEYALPDKKKYPIHTPEMIKKAIAYFNQHTTKFDPLEALKFAGRVKKAALKHDIALEGTILSKYAGLTSKSFSDDLKAALRGRRRYVLEDQAKIYDELLEKSASFGVIKTAEYLEKVDRKLGVNKLWNRGVDDPYLSVFGLIKEANCSYKGKMVKKTMLKKAAEAVVDAETLRELEGPDGIEIFESLPIPIKDKIVKNL